MVRYDTVMAELRERPRSWLVTGGAGFIGSHLAETLLRNGQRVTALDNFATGYRRNIDDVLAKTRGLGGSFTLIEGDIRDPDTCLSACESVDFVLHQAALGSVPRSIVDPVLFHEVNVNGTMNMMVAARDAGVHRFVYASSSAVYGTHFALPKVEPAIGDAASPYGLTKRVDELYGELFRSVYGLETVGLRYFNVFGRRQDPRSTYAAVIPQWVRRLLRGEPCYIHGDGETTRDFCYVDNVVQANLLAATSTLSHGDQIYNVGCGERISLNELFGTLRSALAKFRPEIAEMKPIHDDFRSGDVRHSQADVGKIRRNLGFVPTHLLELGLRETLPWYVELFAGAEVGAAAS